MPAVNQNTPPSHPGYAPSYPPPQGPPPMGYVVVTLSLQARDAIDSPLSTDFLIAEVSRPNTLPRTPIVHSRSRIRATHNPPGHRLASTLLPLTHGPIHISYPPALLAHISHPTVLLAHINHHPVLLTMVNINHLQALLPIQGHRGRIPLLRTQAVTQVHMDTNNHPALTLRVHPRFQETALATFRTVRFPNRVRLGDV
jgi:hypothetical protein